MSDKKVREDTRIVAGMGAIYCAGNHRDRERTPLVSDATALGVYGRRVPRLCDECAEHIRYAEKRRAYETQQRSKKKSEITPGLGSAMAAPTTGSGHEEDIEVTGDGASFPPSASMCHKCSTKALVLMDGCATCLNCGYSKCG